MYKLRFIVAAMLVISLVIGCAGTKPSVEGDKQQLTGEKRPSWVNNPKKKSDDKIKAFAGISRQYAMEQDARRDAQRAAFEEALLSMGAFGKLLIERAASEAGVATTIVNPGVAENQLSQWRAKGAVLGDVDEWHVEKWREFSGGKWSDFYVVNCLFLMPRDAVKRFAKELLEQQAAAEKAEENQKNIQRALEQMERLQTEDW